MLNKTVIPFTSQLVEFSTNVLFDTVISRIDAQINKNSYNQSDYIAQIAKITDQQAFISQIGNQTKNGFMYFTSYQHDRIISLATDHPVSRNHLYVLGNPKIAQNIMILNPSASQGLPPRLLVLEKEDRNGTNILYSLPSSVLNVATTGQENGNLTEVLLDLDAKFEELVTTITSSALQDLD